ncbi:BMP family ABC transporter substrate-binding protein [Butyrivibrio sp. CB08]|uniref:BMP family ABC transporter substrate-binding protein n=1 Tax=Butyrivibrio sp. CB08 TaxID=2364879 RepID=UPI000EA93D46|nr:BMP family ABC transporter substrate-binding protein [Butyrivibrio sp. CB08]RKM59214.1 BMP family ABC transporter substrate-binding protein [Butyrivibrio sp. CB08]
MKRLYITTVATCLAILAFFIVFFRVFHFSGGKEHLTVGFIYDNDESTAYTYNFSLAKDAVEKKYGEKVDILTCSNVLEEDMEEPLRDLASKGCDIIFFNGYSELVMKLAPEYPNTQFCQTSYMDMNGVSVPANYHTFKGEAYQARYISGIVAGMKIQQMIDEGIITPDQALVGFVAANPSSEVISGYTAFILGIRSVVPNAKMEVCYTHTWSSYALEKSAAQTLIGDGCVVVSQHTDTIGPAIACEEETANGTPVYFVSYNQSMSEVAPASALVSSRICWEKYVVPAVDAVMENKKIESKVSGNIHGSDVSAGYADGWVEMDDLNLQNAAPGTQEAVNSAIEKFKRHKGKVDFVFKGDFTGVNPDDASDTYDLRNGYVENENTSYPLFHYIIPDIITVIEG